MINEEYTKQIKAEFIKCTSGAIERTNKALATPEKSGGLKPFHSKLLLNEAIVWSQFERSYSTSFGQALIERVSKLVALAYGAKEAVGQKETTVELYENQLSAIEDHLKNIRNKNSGQRGDWEKDIENLMAIEGSGEKKSERVISDLWYNRAGLEHFVSIKTVKPNIDQTAQAKKDLLLIKLSNPDSNVFFGLYYNPYGEKRESYKPKAAAKIFDFTKDEVVLVGKEYWDTIGGDGAYEKILKIAEDSTVESTAMINAFAKKHGLEVKL